MATMVLTGQEIGFQNLAFVSWEYELNDELERLEMSSMPDV